MPQNKTVVPDVNLNQSEIESSIYDELYSRNPESSNATYVPGVSQKTMVGVKPSALSVDEHFDDREEEIEPRTIILKKRVVVGVLFSISKGILGELFPVYLGDNIIGSAEGCDICLLEKTVSSRHALLNVSHPIGSMGYQISITDLNSMYGTLVNDVDARYDVPIVSEDDIITCGLHYKLLLKLFDVEESHLHEDDEFEAVQINDDSITIPQRSNLSNAFYTPTKNNPNSSKTVLY